MREALTFGLNADDFEVSIFLTELSTRHSLLAKQKQFHDRRGRIRSNSGKLTNWLLPGSKDEPVEVPEDGQGDDDSVIIPVEDEEAIVNLDDIPEVEPGQRPRKRRQDNEAYLSDSGTDDEDDEDAPETRPNPSRKRRRGSVENTDPPGPARENQQFEISDDDKKQLALRNIVRRLQHLRTYPLPHRQPSGKQEG